MGHASSSRTAAATRMQDALAPNSHARRYTAPSSSGLPGGEQGVALEVHRLAIVGGGDMHVADEHVRKTLDLGLSHAATIRQGLSRSFGRV